MNSRAISTLAPALALLAGAATALAEINVFTNGAGSNNWSVGANWSLGHPPTSSDHAVIPAGFGPQLFVNGFADCDSLTVHGSLYVQGFMRVRNGFVVNGQLSIYKPTNVASTLFLFKGQGVVNGNLSLFSANLGDDNFFDNSAELIVNPGGTLGLNRSANSAPILSVNTTNYGTINFDAPACSVGGTNNATRTLKNYGTFHNLGGGSMSSAATTAGRTLVFNFGTWKFTHPSVQSIDDDVIFTNENYLLVDGADLTIENLINIYTSNMTLGIGSWNIHNGGRLRTVEGRSISKIGSGASVVLLGTGSSFDALFPCSEIEGFLSVGDGADLTLYPPQLGNVIQRSGDVVVGAGSHLYIQGAYWQQDGRINRVYQNATEAGSGIFDVLLSSTFNGSVFCQFLDESAIQTGDEFPIVQMAPNACCGVNGPFSSFEVVGQGSNNMALRYEADRIYVTALCAADFDQDGFITGLDFDAFVLAFESGDTTADFDHDGFITGVDYDLYVETFEGGC